MPSRTARFATAVEKVAWTYVQAVIALAIAGSITSYDDAHSWSVFAIAGLPALFTAASLSIGGISVGVHSFYEDLLYRTLRTFGATALTVAAFQLSQPQSGDVASVAKGALVGGIAAVLVVLKGAAARKLGQAGTPATLPVKLDAADSNPKVNPCVPEPVYGT